jgi:hypothetical protein
MRGDRSWGKRALRSAPKSSSKAVVGACHGRERAERRPSEKGRSRGGVDRSVDGMDGTGRDGDGDGGCRWPRAGPRLVLECAGPSVEESPRKAPGAAGRINNSQAMWAGT